jgi:hypothetical protein
MTASEQAVFARTGEIAALAHVDLSRRGVAVLISETMRLNDAGDPVLGVWESGERRIVIRRPIPVAAPGGWTRPGCQAWPGAPVALTSQERQSSPAPPRNPGPHQTLARRQNAPITS